MTLSGVDASACACSVDTGESSGWFTNEINVDGTYGAVDLTSRIESFGEHTYCVYESACINVPNAQKFFRWTDNACTIAGTSTFINDIDVVVHLYAETGLVRFLRVTGHDTSACLGTAPLFITASEDTIFEFPGHALTNIPNDWFNCTGIGAPTDLTGTASVAIL